MFSSLDQLQSQRVLVVEDDYVIADDLRRALESAGCVVMGPVASVEKALFIVAQGGVDLAILDVNLAGDMVYPVAEALRKKHIDFIFATGYDAAAIPARFSDVLRCEKPVDLEHALTALLAHTANRPKMAGNILV